MVKTDDDPPELPDEISTSSKKAKQDCCYSNEQHCRLIPTFQQLLPEEVLYEVFLRLPVKSLIRIRCVSKGTRRLIDSPVFIKNYNILRSVITGRDRSDEDYAILFNPNYLNRDSGPIRLFFSLDFEKDDDNNLNLNHAKAIDFNCSVAQEGEIMGCCNGVFCFKNFQSKCYVFWNPSNGTFYKVDCSSCKFPLQQFPLRDASMGYDCVNDDYKIIRFILSEASLEVYSLRNDAWRKIPWDWDRVFPLGHYSFRGGVCLGGVIYWSWVDHSYESESIVAFDLATETFTSLPPPLEATLLHMQPSDFADFGGRLCVTFSLARLPLYCRQTIWVMEKHGSECSWTKLHDFVCAPKLIRSLYYFPNMKRRLLCHNKWLSWWDPQDGSFEKIEIPELLNDLAMCRELNFCKVYVYVRNLVRLDQTLV